MVMCKMFILYLNRQCIATRCTRNYGSQERGAYLIGFASGYKINIQRSPHENVRCDKLSRTMSLLSVRKEWMSCCKALGNFQWRNLTPLNGVSVDSACAPSSPCSTSLFCLKMFGTKT